MFGSSSVVERVIPARLPSLCIDGVAHDLSDLTVLTRAERIPGGLPWSLELDEAATSRSFNHWPPLKTGRVSSLLEAQLFIALQKLLRLGGRPRFFIAAIDAIEVSERRVRIRGRCTPLVIDVFGAGGLTTRV